MPTSAYLQAVVFFLLASVALFVSAGTVAILDFWIYLAIFATFYAAVSLGVDPDLLRERMRPGGQKPPLALSLFSVVLFAHWIIAGLDRGRLHFSDHVPSSLRAFGLIAVAAGFALCFAAMRVNRFFSSVVRIQSDRGQYVVTTGPYAVIRHPGYIGAIVVIVASGIALGSWLSVAVLVIFSLPGLLYRVIIEDQTLMAELPGYGDYAQRVRWRLIPGIW